MNLEGRLRLSIQLDAGKIVAASVLSERPVYAGRVLEGRPPAWALATIALLFSLCGKAQTVALAEALDAASRREADPAVRSQRQLLVEAEAAREHLWRLAVDVPRHLGTAPQPGKLTALRRLFDQVAAAGGPSEAWWDLALTTSRASAWQELADALDAFLAEAVFGEPPARWSNDRDSGGFEAWLAQAPAQLARNLTEVLRRDFGDCAVSLLALPEALSAVPDLARDRTFAKTPSSRGEPAETGALARQRDAPLLRGWLAQHGRGPAARLLARLVELAQAPARLRHLAAGTLDPARMQAVTIGEGGAALVETARGVLMHYVRLNGDELAQLRIVAPTEWNFHPQGAWVRGLLGEPAPDPASAHQKAALLAHALDPCVAWELAVHHA